MFEVFDELASQPAVHERLSRVPDGDVAVHEL